MQVGLLAVVVVIVIVATPEVAHSDLIAAAETVPVSLPLVPGNMRMTVLVAIADFWPPVVVEIPMCAFKPIVKAAALDFIQLPWRRIPVAIMIAILGRGWSWRPRRHAVRSGRNQTCGSQE